MKRGDTSQHNGGRCYGTDKKHVKLSGKKLPEWRCNMKLWAKNIHTQKVMGGPSLRYEVMEQVLQCQRPSDLRWRHTSHKYSLLTGQSTVCGPR
jgi:hypothetical protein